MVTIDLCARVTKGANWPDGQKGTKPANILIMASEDTQAEISGRIYAHGGDLKRAFTLDEIEDAEGTRLPSIPGDLSIVEEIIRKRKVKLLIIDPIMVFLGVHSGADQTVRRAVAPLAKMAERTNCTVIMVRHLTKNVRDARTGGGGSMGIIGQARFGYFFGRDPDDPNRRLFACTKLNVGKEPETRAYELKTRDDGLAQAMWFPEPSKWTADDLAKRRVVDADEREERREVTDFIEDFMTEQGGFALPPLLFEAGKAGGWSRDQIKRGKKQLRIKSVKVSDYWVWVPQNYKGVVTSHHVANQLHSV
jgi:hypothetical protein